MTHSVTAHDCEVLCCGCYAAILLTATSNPLDMFRVLCPTIPTSLHPPLPRLLLITVHLPLPPPRNPCQILISLRIEIPPTILGPQNRQQDNIRIHAAHKDTNDQSVLVPFNLSLRRQREFLANSRLDRRTRARRKITKLIRRADYECSERAGRKFHEVNGNHAPCALHAELLEKGGCDDTFVADESVGIQQCAAENAHDDDADAAPEDGGRVADERAAGHGAQVGDDLGDGYGVGGEVVLVGEHGWVEVLGAVGHEVEACGTCKHVIFTLLFKSRE